MAKSGAAKGPELDSDSSDDAEGVRKAKPKPKGKLASLSALSMIGSRSAKVLPDPESPSGGDAQGSVVEVVLQARRLAADIRSGFGGVEVVAVEEGGAAFALGLRPGDVVVAVGAKEYGEGGVRSVSSVPSPPLAPSSPVILRHRLNTHGEAPRGRRRPHRRLPTHHSARADDGRGTGESRR